MKVQVFLMIIAINAVQVLGTCDSAKCPEIPVHYQELRCKPIIKDGECCPSSFDCKHLDEQDDSKCHFKGKVFEAGDSIDNDLLKRSCIGAAHCSPAGKFVYAHKDCAEFFSPPLELECIRQYSRDSCCSTGTVCGDEAAKLKACEFEGKTYKEGARMSSIDNICYECFCTSDFENKTVTQNKDCVQVSCNLELLEPENIKDKCAPIYHPDSCCPYNWLCPKNGDKVVPGERKNDSKTPKCKFGDLEFEIGDALSTVEKNCSKCSCKVPPMLDCVFTPGC